MNVNVGDKQGYRGLPVTRNSQHLGRGLDDSVLIFVIISRWEEVQSHPNGSRSGTNYPGTQSPKKMFTKE